MSPAACSSQMCLGRMYTSIVGSFGSGTLLVIFTVRASTAVAARLAVIDEWFIQP